MKINIKHDCIHLIINNGRCLGFNCAKCKKYQKGVKEDERYSGYKREE